MFKIDPKNLVTVASILVSASMISIIVTDSHAAGASSSDTDVKGTSTISTAPKKIVTPATIVSVKTDTPSTNSTNSQDTSGTDENTILTASADQEVYNDEPGATPSEPETPVIPVVPTPIPDPVPEVPVVPTPQPTFSIALLKDQAVTTDVLGVKQIIVPFNVLLETGFVATTYGQPQCSFLSAPAGHNVLCGVNQKEANTGTLSLQYTALSPAGHYEVQVSYIINDVVRTDVFAFDIAAPVIAVPALF